MKLKLMAFLATLFVAVTGFGASTMTPDVSELPNVVVQVSNLTAEVATKVASNVLASTTLGSEGIRQVGTVGGYDLDEYFKDTALRGPSRDHPIFTYQQYPAFSLTVSNTVGDVYSPTDGYFHLDASVNTNLINNAVNFAYWNNTPPNNTIKWTTTRPNVDNNIVLAIFVTAFGAILEVDGPEASGDFPLNTRAGASQITPSLVVGESALTYSALGTALSNVYMTGGVEYHDMRSQKVHANLNLSGSNPCSLVAFGRTSTSNTWDSTVTNIVPVGLWDNGTNVVACNPTNWYKGLFMALQDSGRMIYIYPQAEYTNSIEAIAGYDPVLPPGFTPYIPMCTEYVFQGSDTVLRVDGQYWVDRRFQIRRPGTTVISGGRTPTPSLNLVMLAGGSLGGLLPYDAGLPTKGDQLTSKDYVDSKINNVNSGKAYVDKGGNDATAQLRSSILTFQTIQKAIDAAAAVANDTNRYLVIISPGVYDLNGTNIIMKEYVSLEGADIQGCIILGAIHYLTNYIDVSGSEIAKLSVFSQNEPAVVINSGSDDAYAGIRSCWLRANYDKSVAEKSVVLIKRGQAEDYGTTYHELNILTTNSSADHAAIFSHTTDINNQGLSTFTAFSASSILSCNDTNDEVSLMHTYDNTDAGCINECIAGNFNIVLTGNTIHNNKIKLVSHNNAIGRTLSMGNAIRLTMDETNNCNLFMAFAQGGSGDNVAIIRNNHVRIVSGSSSNIWFGAATTSNDNIRIYDTEIIQKNAFNYYPRRYTNEGASGHFYINTPHQNGDSIIGGAIDLFTPNSLYPIIENKPNQGHIKIYLDTTVGLEQPFYMDSTGAKYRICRDTLFLGYNGETNTLNAGEVVYVYDGLTNGAQFIKRAISTDLGIAHRAWGVINTLGGIPAGGIAPVMSIGQTTSPFDTSAFSEGDILYLSSTTPGGLVKDEPLTPPAVSVQIGWVSVAATNGTMIVHIQKPDSLGKQLPSYYASYTNPVFGDSRFMLTDTTNTAAKFSNANIPTGTTNVYTFPAAGGQLAVYTDIQLVPVSVVIGETGGIIKGKVVYQAGVSGGKPLVKYADRGLTDNLPIIGVTMGSGNLGDIIEIANFGPVKDIDTSAFSPNDMIYLGTNGLLSGPSSLSSDAIILLGTCLSSNAVTGSMMVNVRSYFQAGNFNGSLRYSVKNASSSSNAVAAFFAINDTNESIRMVVRGGGNARGHGAIISSSANGSLWYASARRQSLIWDIDMTDSGTEFTHLNWPMMALVPQSGVASNAFLGIGTTNPLTMLYVNGSATASNGFRLSTGAYAGNEWVTFSTTTNLIIITSNAFVSADTSLSNSLVGVMNSKDTVVSNAFVAADTVVSNAFVAADTSLSNSLVGVMNSKDTVVSNAFVAADTNLQGQISSATNRIQILEDKPRKFLANIGTTFNQSLPQPLTKVLYTNLVSNIGGKYSNTVARWIPGVLNATIEIHGSIRLTGVANDNTILLQIYRNGSLKSTVMDKAMRAGTYGETYVYTDITTNAADYYEVWSTLSNARSTTGSGADNWWSGQIIP